VGKRGSIGSLVSWDHVGVLGLVGDLAVAEKSPANFVSVGWKTNLTCGSLCQRLKFQILCNLAKIISSVYELHFVTFLEIASF
jgi:hypothetical protein